MKSIGTARPLLIARRTLCRYGREGAQVKAASLSDSRMSGGRQDRRCTLQHIKDEQLGQGAPAYIQVR